MTVVAELLTRNGELVRDGCAGPVAAVPRLGLVVVTCADPRVDPAHVLGLEPGDAAVVRNAGGRVTPDLLRTLAIMALAIAEEASPRPFEIVLLHHTDCGVARSAHHRELMAAYFGVPADDLDAKAMTDPDAAVRADVLAIRDSGLLPPDVLVSGLVHDVATGRVRRPAATGSSSRSPSARSH